MRTNRLQTGVVLPITLIFLVVMMVLGVAGIRNVMLEEKMAGNLRSQQLAFQAAEQALRFCEKRIEINDENPPGIKVLPELPGTRYWEVSTNWHNSQFSNIVPVTQANVADPLAARPECMVERFDPLPSPTNPREKRPKFRITARGVGTISSAAVYLQSYLVLSPRN